MFDSFPRPCWCLNFLWRYGEQQKRTREARPKWAVSAFGRAKKVEERSEARKEEWGAFLGNPNNLKIPTVQCGEIQTFF